MSTWNLGDSLRRRLFFVSLATLAVILVLAGVGLSSLFARHVNRRAAAELDNHMRTLLASLEIAPEGTLKQSAFPSDPLFAQPYSGLYWQVSESGKAILRSRSLWDFEIGLPSDELAASAAHYHDLRGPGTSTLLTLERPLKLASGSGVREYRVVTAIDRQTIGKAVSDFNRDLAIALFALAFVLAAASLLQMQIGLAPLARLQERLARVRRGEHYRLTEAAPLEVQPLIDEINGLLDEQQALIERARGRAADLAHGLKTPLTVLDGDVRRLREKGETELAAQIDIVSRLMRRHVQAELARARIAGGRTSRSVGISTRPAVEAVAGVIARTPEGQTLRYDIDIDPEDKIAMDRKDFEEVIGNLLENAVRYAKELVCISVVNDSGRTRVAICDDGPGIPTDEVARVLTRGESLDQRSNGAGIGLPIVNEILAVYDSTLKLDRSACGGLCASFVLRKS